MPHLFLANSIYPGVDRVFSSPPNVTWIKRLNPRHLFLYILWVQWNTFHFPKMLKPQDPNSNQICGSRASLPNVLTLIVEFPTYMSVFFSVWALWYTSSGIVCPPRLVVPTNKSDPIMDQFQPFSKRDSTRLDSQCPTLRSEHRPPRSARLECE